MADALRADVAAAGRAARRASSDDYRSYVINYNLGKDLVKQCVEAHGGVGVAARQALGRVCRSSAVAATAVRAPVIDSHCHLADATFSAELEGVVARAKTAGVERALVILEAGNEAGSGARRAECRHSGPTSARLSASIPMRRTSTAPTPSGS